MADDQVIVRAAGAVLWRHTKGKAIEIAIIHRPRYDDWSLPKGKLENGEMHIGCAFREVLEETGVTPIFGPEIGEVVYIVGNEKKIVKYWAAMASNIPYGQPDEHEVDEILWLDPTAAKKKLTLDDDRSIVDFFLDFGVDTQALVLLRHAKAVKREDWDGDDGDRPLAHVGQLQAKRLFPLYFPYAIKEIHSSDAMRCIETIEPMARTMQLTPIFSTDLSEYRYTKDKEASLDYAQDLLNRGVAGVICSHNPILPKLLKKLIGKKNFKQLDGKLEPGQSWVLHHRDGEIVAIDSIEIPQISA